MAKKSTAAKIREYMTAHPDAKPADIAEKCNVKLAYVYVVRSVMKKKAVIRKFTQPNGKLKTRLQSTETVKKWQPPPPLPVPPAPVLADMVNHPPHYKTGGIETIDFIEAKGLNYHLGNVVKYVTRADHKGDRLENLKKAKWYLDREIASAATAK